MALTATFPQIGVKVSTPPTPSKNMDDVGIQAPDVGSKPTPFANLERQHLKFIGFLQHIPHYIRIIPLFIYLFLTSTKL